MGAARLQRAQERRHAHGRSPGRGPPLLQICSQTPAGFRRGGTRRAGHSRGRSGTPHTARDKDPRRARGAPPFSGPFWSKHNKTGVGAPSCTDCRAGGGGIKALPSWLCKIDGSARLLKSGECAGNPPAMNQPRAGPSRERGPDAPPGSFPSLQPAKPRTRTPAPRSFRIRNHLEINLS